MQAKSLYNIYPSGGLLSTQFLKELGQIENKDGYVKANTFLIGDKKTPTPKDLYKQIDVTWKNLLKRWHEISIYIDSYDVSKARKKWIIPLLEALGYDPQYLKKDTNVSEEKGIKIALSHRGGDWEHAPIIHTVSPSQDLDEKITKGRGNKSPHDSLQIYLNETEGDLWGIITNGKVLRILRKYHHTYTKGYVEFDLEGIFVERNFSEYVALYRLAHPSRFIPYEEDDMPLEHFYKKSRAAGEKIGKDLRKNVKEAIESLGNGFLTRELINKLIEDQEECQAYYREILHVIYRLIFLLFAEQRGMLPTRDSLYAEAYSITRLRERAEKEIIKDRHNDIWQGLLVTFDMIKSGVDDPKIGIFGYNGSLFDDDKIKLLRQLNCENTKLLKAIRDLTYFESEKTLQRISYLDLGVEEIGSIYESFLDYTPRVLTEDIVVDNKTFFAGTFFLDPRGSARKSTGSYYTDIKLVDELISSALKPVLENRLKRTEKVSVEEKEEALLSIKVCDPACGSGAFLIAATKFLGSELAKIRTDTEYPPEKAEREARRDVLQRCIYGVDLNPMAVELTRVSLWIDACVNDKPLNFLDHHIKCGNSLIGTTKELMKNGVLKDAYSLNGLKDDRKDLVKKIKEKNKNELKGVRRIDDPSWGLRERVQRFFKEYIDLTNLSENDSSEVEYKKNRYNEFTGECEYKSEKLFYDAWTASFFWPVDEINDETEALTHADFLNLKDYGSDSIDQDKCKKISKLAEEYKFFHWEIEFPDVFSGDDPGFDCVIGNPPWERVKLQEKEFFKYRDPGIANASNKSKRDKLIKELSEKNPFLFTEFKNAFKLSKNLSNFFRTSDRFKLTSKGDINFYPLFTELNRTIINGKGRVGMIVASGIATDFSTKDFFESIVKKKQLASLYDFENREGIFPGVHRSYKFSLITLTGEKLQAQEADFAFFLTDPDQLTEEERHFTLTDEDIELLNPNTKTCPIFRSKKDAELTKKIYRKHPILIKENSNGEDENPWGISFLRMFDMSNDSNLFKNKEELESEGFTLDGNKFQKNGGTYLPLYEGKMIHHYDHRFATFDGIRTQDTRDTTLQEHQDTNWEPMPRYWVKESEVNNRVSDKYSWLLGFRDITNTTNERTAVFCVFGRGAVSNKMPILLLDNDRSNTELILLYAILSSIVYDYVSRQCIGGTSMNFYLVKQIVIPSPSTIRKEIESLMTNKILKLTYTSHSLSSFASDLGYDGPPFKWDPEEREHLRAELDAIVAHLYGVTREELDYILETFPIVKRKDIEKYGEYRTKRLILEYYDRYEGKFEGIK